MNYLKYGTSQSSKMDEAQTMLKPLTPRSEMPRTSYGSMLSSVQTLPGLCSRDRLCVRKDGHEGPCWPKES